MTKSELQIAYNNLEIENRRLLGVFRAAEERYKEEAAKNRDLRHKYFCLTTAIKEISEANMALTSIMERSI